VLGLDFYECRQCATVYAGPTPPPFCSDCGDDEFEELAGDLRREPYFWRRRRSERD
jgi:hypothetical protein